MVRNYLKTTGTSTSSERVFSTGRELLGITRHSMSSLTMKACICLRSLTQGNFFSNENETIAKTVDGDEMMLKF